MTRLALASRATVTLDGAGRGGDFAILADDSHGLLRGEGMR